MLILQAEARMDIEGLEDGTDNSVRSDAYMYDAEKLMEDWDKLDLNLITIRAFIKKYSSFPEMWEPRTTHATNQGTMTIFPSKDWHFTETGYCMV